MYSCGARTTSSKNFNYTTLHFSKVRDTPNTTRAFCNSATAVLETSKLKLRLLLNKTLQVRHQTIPPTFAESTDKTPNSPPD